MILCYLYLIIEFETTQEHAINNDGVLKIVKELGKIEIY